MEGLLWIAVIGLAVALGAALLVIRRRTDELDRVVDGREPGRATADRRPRRRPRTPAPGATSGARRWTCCPVGVLHVGADHRITAANAARPRPARRRRDACRAAASWRRSSTRASRPRWTRCPSAAATTVEHRVGTPEPRTLVVRAHRLAPDDLVVVLEDVTELRRLQQIRTEFIDNLGHELRTPLSTVTLLAETLAREAEIADDPAPDARAHRADRGGDRATSPRWSTRCWTSPGSRADPSCASTTTWISPASPPPPPSGSACSPSAAASRS